jgi:glycosyltransferase involved in cell wall biosynthesis
MSKTLTILTPTYNRDYTLTRLYESLCVQTNQDFLWLIVDDGSTDNTRALISTFCEEQKIKICYLMQENAGKHIAINTGVQESSSFLTFIVDSDDYLTADAVETILSYETVIKENQLMGATFLRGYDERTVIGDCYSQAEKIDNFIDMRYNRELKGDRAEVVVTELLKQTPFPKISEERFMSEGVVWKQLAHKGNSLFVNKIIYITEYLEDGLTHAGRKLLINNPLGSMLNSKLGMTKDFKFKLRIRNGLLYCAYSFFASKTLSCIVKESEEPKIAAVCLPGGYLVYRIWKWKYD